MPVTDLLERNHKLYGEEVALVELNPTMKDTRRTTWKEYDLVQQTSSEPYRRKSPGAYLTRKPIGWLTCLWREGFRKETGWRS